MKKKILLLSAAAAAGGLLYALESNRRRQHKVATEQDDSTSNSETSGNGRVGTISVSDRRETISGRQTREDASTVKNDNGKAAIKNEAKHELDDQGTDQSQALHILRHIRDDAFDASDEKLALALGRPTDEIEQWISGAGLIDGDVLLKARTLAIQRGLPLE